jgi:DNA (cytosine-5)-methyltransferase 1
MENVPWLVSSKKSDSFSNFIKILEKNNYSYDYKVVDCTKYWVPQRRKRLVLLASRIWDISLIKETHKKEVTVRDAIWDLPKIKCWETCKTDRYHVWQNLTQKNLNRLKVIPHDWWDLLDVDEKYWPECYKKESWKRYMQNIYWRMYRDKAAPTMTTLCTGIWNWRFSHPEQDRAITVREAARIQTFPDNYEFFPDWEQCNVLMASKFIGNAVPVRLWEVIGESIKKVL